MTYLAELPEHAVAERIQHFRNHTVADSELMVAGRRLALVAAEIPDGAAEEVLDLCDPRELARLEIGPDEIAARNRTTTQRIAAQVRADGRSGLRWWSAFFGEWHGVVLFRDRLGGALRYDAPVPLGLDQPAVIAAARALGIRLEAG